MDAVRIRIGCTGLVSGSCSQTPRGVLLGNEAECIIKMYSPGWTEYIDWKYRGAGQPASITACGFVFLLQTLPRLVCVCVCQQCEQHAIKGWWVEPRPLCVSGSHWAKLLVCASVHVHTQVSSQCISSTSACLCVGYFALRMPTCSLTRTSSLCPFCLQPMRLQRVSAPRLYIPNAHFSAHASLV